MSGSQTVLQPPPDLGVSNPDFRRKCEFFVFVVLYNLPLVYKDGFIPVGPVSGRSALGPVMTRDRTRLDSVTSLTV